jgi:DNA-binding MarR family transcriptional regulator
MSFKIDEGSPRQRRRLVTEVKAALRGLNGQLTQLNHRVGTRLGLKDADLDCLDVIQRHGPFGPSTLARLAGVHPATLTGVLDRLQRAGWITRDRDPEAADRRAVTVRALPTRNPEMFRLYAGMNHAMDEVCAAYTEAELTLLADFLRRTAEAGRTATHDLSAHKIPAQDP